MNEQPLNLRVSLQEIRRHRLLVTTVALLCAFGAIAFAALRPPDSTAVALVLLPSGGGSSSGQPALSTGTQTIVAKSMPVLAAAGTRVTPQLEPAQLKQLVTVTALSQQVLEIQARATRGTSAAQIANAVAASYIKYAGQLRESSSGVSALQQESNLLTQQIQSLQSQVNTVLTRIASEGAASSAGQSDNSLVGSLRNEQNQVTLQLNGVKGQIVATQVTGGSAGNTMRVLQTATVQPASHTSPLIKAGIVGLAIGLLGSIGFVLVRRQRDRRLRLRDEIAHAAGVPVFASLEAPPCTTAKAWRSFLESRPRAASTYALRRLLHTVLNSGTEQITEVRVISFVDDSPALATGPLLALHAAASGTLTALVPGDHRKLVPLRASFTGPERVGRGMPFAIGLDDAGEPPSILVSIILVDKDSPTSSPSAGVNVLSISPGFATAEEVARLALKAADGGSSLDIVVVVNADALDHTNGQSADDRLRLVPSHADANRGRGGGRLGPQTGGVNDSAEFPMTGEY